jgi:hypothetical protein
MIITIIMLPNGKYGSNNELGCSSQQVLSRQPDHHHVTLDPAAHGKLPFAKLLKRKEIALAKRAKKIQSQFWRRTYSFQMGNMIIKIIMLPVGKYSSNNRAWL